MTRKLEQLFDLPSGEESTDSPTVAAEVHEQLVALDHTIDKIDTALPLVRGMDATDREMDELADLAKGSYEELMTLGMQVDSRFASEIFSVASNMLGHAITAKTAKLDKKLKMIDLQLKKAKLDQTAADPAAAPTMQGTGVVLSRNDLLEKILNTNRQNPQ